MYLGKFLFFPFLSLVENRKELEETGVLPKVHIYWSWSLSNSLLQINLLV